MRALDGGAVDRRRHDALGICPSATHYALAARHQEGTNGMRVTACWAMGALLCAAGCGPSGVMLATEEERRLEGRAQDLLIRATQSQEDVVCANAMEALVHVAPD